MEMYFGNSLQQERKYLDRMFFVFTLAFVLYSIYLLPQGNYDQLICPRYVREILLDTVTLLVDFIVILSVLNLHRTTFKDTTAIPEKSPEERKISKK
jgi:hypothetical protein